MVRIKHRYLLVQILYPTKAPPNYTASSLPSTADDAMLRLHAPTPDTITPQALLRLLRAQISSLFGDYGSGLASAGLAIKYWSNATSTFILRCDRSVFRLAWAACTFVKELKIPLKSENDAQEMFRGRGQGGRSDPNVMASSTTALPCTMQVLRVSGTIKKAEEEAVRRARMLCGRAKGLSVAVDSGFKLPGSVDAFENNRGIEGGLDVDEGEFSDESDVDEVEENDGNDTGGV